jgi:hypothetical protein
MLPQLSSKTSKGPAGIKAKKDAHLAGQNAEAQLFLTTKPEKYGNKDADVVIR